MQIIFQTGEFLANQSTDWTSIVSNAMVTIFTTFVSVGVTIYIFRNDSFRMALQRQQDDEKEKLIQEKHVSTIRSILKISHSSLLVQINNQIVDVVKTATEMEENQSQFIPVPLDLNLTVEHIQKIHATDLLRAFLKGAEDGKGAKYYSTYVSAIYTIPKIMDKLSALNVEFLQRVDSKNAELGKAIQKMNDFANLNQFDRQYRPFIESLVKIMSSFSEQKKTEGKYLEDLQNGYLNPIMNLIKDVDRPSPRKAEVIVLLHELIKIVQNLATIKQRFIIEYRRTAISFNEINQHLESINWVKRKQ